MTTKAKPKSVIRCDRCQVHFVAGRVDQSFCSNACKQAAFRQRRAQEKLDALETDRKLAVAVTMADGPNSTVTAVTSRNIIDRILRRKVEHLDVSEHPVVRPASVSYRSSTHGDRPKKPSTTYDPYTAGAPSRYERAAALRNLPAQKANPTWDFQAWHKSYTAEILRRATPAVAGQFPDPPTQP